MHPPALEHCCVDSGGCTSGVLDPDCCAWMEDKSVASTAEAANTVECGDTILNDLESNCCWSPMKLENELPRVKAAESTEEEDPQRQQTNDDFMAF